MGPDTAFTAWPYKLKTSLLYLLRVAIENLVKYGLPVSAVIEWV
jgi:hypothetical protein